MKVFDLQCAGLHVFEGWFGSEADFADQMARRLVQCPVCGDGHVEKRLSAPRLNLSRSPELPGQTLRASAPDGQGSADLALAPPQAHTRQAHAGHAHVHPAEATQALLRLARAVLEQTQDVGHRFAEEARSIHYGESQARPIRGQATPQQTRELLEEGVPVLPFVLPHSLKGPLQ